ncbi:hypothetical protein DPEC_G00353850 [Dallia pectoralis]|uniref:Uncharacterized protein n=1 Tax=Dallia pectoralis TaxID=75939 RepID=A0ACC2F2V3_DALPE|nr:hypothetical protein DPEC_G00353850 [Dallia pectoralis]
MEWERLNLEDTFGKTGSKQYREDLGRWYCARKMAKMARKNRNVETDGWNLGKYIVLLFPANTTLLMVT